MDAIIIPISRPQYFNKMISSIEMMDLYNNNVDLLLYGKKEYIDYWKSKNMKYRILGIEDESEEESGIEARRLRVAAIHNNIKKYVKNYEHLLIIEDDTIVPPYTYIGLKRCYAQYNYAGFVSGVEVGRWGTRYIGLWTVDDIYNTKTATSTGILNGIQEVDASGLYCLMTKSEYYSTHNFNIFNDMIGPDFNYGISLRRSGLKNYADFSIKCLHLTPNTNIKVDDNVEIIKLNF